MAHIRTILFQLLMRYTPDLGGVVLTFSNIKLPPNQRHGMLISDEPHITVNVMATAQVFSPATGMELVGRATKVASTHVSLLVYGIFNATINAADMGADYRFDEAASEWVDTRGGGGAVKVGFAAANAPPTRRHAPRTRRQHHHQHHHQGRCGG